MTDIEKILAEAFGKTHWSDLRITLAKELAATPQMQAIARQATLAPNLYDALSVLLDARHPRGDADACTEGACRLAVGRIKEYLALEDDR